MKILYWSIAIVIIDQITKLKVKGINIPWLGVHFEGMPYQSSIKVWGDFFQITFIENPGMAFGLQLGSKLFLTLFTIFATILIFFIIYKNRHETFLLRLSLAFILGGALRKFN
jgi:signal peptidase II